MHGQPVIKKTYLGVYAKVFRYELCVLKDIAISGIHFTAP